MKLYVAGFLFDDKKTKVALIEKQKPEWQKGKLNGIGGKIEPEEESLNAMIREFKEETNVDTVGWIKFCQLYEAYKWYVDFYFLCNSSYMNKLETTTDEIIVVKDLQEAFNSNLIPNLRWLINMALSFDRGETAKEFLIQELH